MYAYKLFTHLQKINLLKEFNLIFLGGRFFQNPISFF